MLLASMPQMVRVFEISGRKLATARGAAGLSQQALATAIGASMSAIYKAEREPVARMFLSKRSALAAALKIPENELLERLAPDKEPDSIIDEAVESFERYVNDLRAAGKSDAEIRAHLYAKFAEIIGPLDLPDAPTPYGLTGSGGVVGGSSPPTTATESTEPESSRLSSRERTPDRQPGPKRSRK
jgi:transcriptional regulator with XRE-family HTH domain